MRIIHVVLASWLLITIGNNCPGKAWRGIIPLKSSRADVERLLGPSSGPLPTYYLSDVTVYFWYSKCRCGDKCKDDLWNVPPDTVTGIYVNLKGIVRLTDLGLDLSQFKKSRLADDVPGSFLYDNAKEGFAIEGGDEYASALIYGPRAEDDYLRCSHNPSTKSQNRNSSSVLSSCESSPAVITRTLDKQAATQAAMTQKTKSPVVTATYTPTSVASPSASSTSKEEKTSRVPRVATLKTGRIRSINFDEIQFPGAARNATPVYVAYGDVTGDEVYEAILVLSNEHQGSAILHAVYVYTMSGLQPKILWRFETGDRADGGLRQVYSENGELVIELFGKDRVIGSDLYKGDEPLCCPKSFTRTRYKWNGKSFVPIDHDVLPNPKDNANPVMTLYSKP